MATNKQNLNPDNVDEWLSSTGFLFPTNEIELSRFDELYKGVYFAVSEADISLERILSGTPKAAPKTTIFTTEVNTSDIKTYRMVARNGNNLPEHILQKMKINQDKSSRDNDEPLVDE